MSLAVVPNLDAELCLGANGVAVDEDLPWFPQDEDGQEATAETEEHGGVFKLSLVADARNAMASREVSDTFCPRKPLSLQDAGLNRDFVEKLICRSLHTNGAACGRRLARDIGLPFRMIEPILDRLKTEMLIVYRSTAAAGDYEYVLSDAGDERAKRYMRICSYAETAPVPLEDYVASVAAQSLTRMSIGEEELEHAFADLLMEPKMLDRLGPAVNAGRGMFLYGAPGNGKTSIAERVVRAYGTEVWIPRTILVDGVCVRLFDPVLHELASNDDDSMLLGEPLEDARWVKIKRPTVVVGGELTMDQLEMRHDRHSNVSEAPLQMKSNCGVLLIDDFGRQAMPVSQLLNRWIVPLEKRYDFQKLPTGKKIQVPFDQLVIFSTNLAPRDLVDEAFLRRLPYKIEAPDPSPQQFFRIAKMVGPALGIHPTEEQIYGMIEKYFTSVGRRMRCCHPRDLLLQVRSYCLYHRKPLELTEETMNFAAENYFAVM
ncbi:MAG: AAA family ATPase [Candidatus Binatia bacterium]